MNSFYDILESIDSLSREDKLALAEIINKRAIEERREEIRKNADESYKEYQSGIIKSKTVDEFMKEISQ